LHTFATHLKYFHNLLLELYSNIENYSFNLSIIKSRLLPFEPTLITLKSLNLINKDFLKSYKFMLYQPESPMPGVIYNSIAKEAIKYELQNHNIKDFETAYFTLKEDVLDTKLIITIEDNGSKFKRTPINTDVGTWEKV